MFFLFGKVPQGNPRFLTGYMHSQQPANMVMHFSVVVTIAGSSGMVRGGVVCQLLGGNILDLTFQGYSSQSPTAIQKSGSSPLRQ